MSILTHLYNQTIGTLTPTNRKALQDHFLHKVIFENKPSIATLEKNVRSWAGSKSWVAVQYLTGEISLINLHYRAKTWTCDSPLINKLGYLKVSDEGIVLFKSNTSQLTALIKEGKVQALLQFSRWDLKRVIFRGNQLLNLSNDKLLVWNSIGRLIKEISFKEPLDSKADYSTTGDLEAFVPMYPSHKKKLNVCIYDPLLQKEEFHLITLTAPWQSRWHEISEVAITGDTLYLINKIPSRRRIRTLLYQYNLRMRTLFSVNILKYAQHVSHNFTTDNKKLYINVLLSDQLVQWELAGGNPLPPLRHTLPCSFRNLPQQMSYQLSHCLKGKGYQCYKRYLLNSKTGQIKQFKYTSTTRLFIEQYGQFIVLDSCNNRLYLQDLTEQGGSSSDSPFKIEMLN